jgi:hypothetical protein
MLRPSPSELVAGVADALEQTVLAELDRGPARNQVIAAVGILRRCATAVARHGPLLHADCVDLARSLEEAAAADPRVVAEAEREGLTSTLADAQRVLGAAYPSVPELVDLDLRLRSGAAAMAAEADRVGSPQLDALRALFARMVDRDGELGLSPW